MNNVPQEETHKLEPDCAVCLQKCQHPTQLPCGHVFCFLCVKGVAFQSRKCAMCRTEIPIDYLDHPVLLEKPCQHTNTDTVEEEYQWYYEGRNGWWKYDERSNTELEMALNAEETECTLLLAGALYVVDFQAMTQVRRSDQTRRRRVRRDTPQFPAKGIAGIKTERSQTKQTKIETEDLASNQIENEIIEIVDDDNENAVNNEMSESVQHHVNEISESASVLLDGIHDVVERLSVINLQDSDFNRGVAEDT